MARSVKSAGQHADRAAYFYRRLFFCSVKPRHDRPELALIDLDEAIRLDDKTADYYLARAAVLERLALAIPSKLVMMGLHQPPAAATQEKLRRALQDIESAFKLDPRRPLVYARLGSLLRTEQLLGLNPKRDEKAEEAFQQALKLDPNSLEACEFLVEMLAFKEPARAMTYMNTFLKSQPENTYAYSRRAKLHTQLKHMETALQDHERAIHLAGMEPDLWNARADTLLAMGKLEDSIRDRQVIAKNLRPEDTYNWCFVGQLLGKLEKYDDALVAYNNAIEWTQLLGLTSPSLQSILFDRANIYAKQGKLDSAQSDLGLILKLESAKQTPDETLIAKVVNALQSLRASPTK